MANSPEPQLSEEQQRGRFINAGKKQRHGNLLNHFFLQVKQNRKWWLLPLLLVMILLAVLIALSGSAAAPFIYTLF